LTLDLVVEAFEFGFEIAVADIGVGLADECPDRAEGTDPCTVGRRAVLA